MRVRRIAASVASAVTVAGLGIAGATPASSAIDYTCASINGLTTVVTNTNVSPGSAVFSATVDFAAGDTLTATWSDINGGATASALYVPTNRSVFYSQTPTATMSYTVTAADVAAGSWAPNFKADITGSVSSATITITCGNPSSPASSAAAIPAWVQAYGIFLQDDACLTGWTNSWQEWAVPVTGGWVCTRSIPSLG